LAGAHEGRDVHGDADPQGQAVSKAGEEGQHHDDARRGVAAAGGGRDTRPAEHDHVLVRERVQRQPLLALLADEVALEERTADHDVSVGDPRQKSDTPLDRPQAGGGRRR
jgi:hypothetical protein